MTARLHDSERWNGSAAPTAVSPLRDSIAPVALDGRPRVDQRRLVGYRLSRLRDQMRLADVELSLLLNPVSLRYALDYRTRGQIS